MRAEVSCLAVGQRVQVGSLRTMAEVELPAAAIDETEMGGWQTQHALSPGARAQGME